MTNTQVRVIKKVDDMVCIAEINTSPLLENDYERKTHFIFCMDVSASMDEPAVPPQADNNGEVFISPENTRLNYITRVLGACLNLVKTIDDVYNDIFVSVVTFSRKVQTIVKQANGEVMTEDAIKKIIRDVKSQGRESTNFERVMQHVMSEVTMITPNSQVSHVNEIVVFMTDGCITQGTNEESELTNLMVGNQQQIPDWRFIGVGTDFDYLLLNSLKLNIDKRDQLPNHPVITVDFMDNIENAHIIYADVISPYLSKSVYNVTLSSLNQYAPVYFGNPTTGILDSKQFHMGIIPAGTTRYVAIRLTDDTQCAFSYSDSKFHPCHGPATTNMVVTRTSFVTLEDSSDDTMLFDVMKLRQECIESVGACYKLIENRCESHNLHRQAFVNFNPAVLATPRRRTSYNFQQSLNEDNSNCEEDMSSSDEEIKTPEVRDREPNNELSSHKECLLTLQEKVKDFLKDGRHVSIRDTLSDILKQCIDDISFAIGAIVRVQSTGYGVLARMVIASRLNSQQYQRSYTITTPSLLDNNDYYENDNQNVSSNVSLMNNNNYSPFTTHVTRSISQVISTQSQHY